MADLKDLFHVSIQSVLKKLHALYNFSNKQWQACVLSGRSCFRPAVILFMAVIITMGMVVSGYEMMVFLSGVFTCTLMVAAVALVTLIFSRNQNQLSLHTVLHPPNYFQLMKDSKNFAAADLFGRYSPSAFFKIVFTIPLVLFFWQSESAAQESLDIISGGASNNTWIHYRDASGSLYNHLSGQAFELLKERAELVENIETPGEWQQRQQYLKETLLNLTGPFPEKNPLNATITRTIEKQEYRVEHIVFESQPEFYVTSSLFIPNNRGGEPAPAILYVSGHTVDGYRSGAYQHVILNLVKKGFIVFAIDPVGQGERLEYYDPETGESAVGGPTTEHAYPGGQAFITGSSLARYMIWDGIRAVDYLLERDEVDPERIGITGMSGGGTQTAYIAALDERIYASVPSNYITSFTRLLQTLGPQDSEQNFFRGIAHGIDHADLLAVRAPKPALMMSTRNDFFSIQGARETAQEVSKIYEAYGEPGNFGMAEEDGGHTVPLKNREAMYAFFQHHLQNPGSADDLDTDILSEDEIRVTESGQVSQSFGGETVYSLNRAEAEQKLSEREQSREQADVHIQEVLETAKSLSGYQAPESVQQPVFTGRFQRDGYSIEKYFTKGEGDYIIPYLLMVPGQPNGKALIYLHPEGKAEEAGEGGEIEWFVKQGFTVLSPDLIGTGEMGSGQLRREWRTSVLTGRSIAGIRAGDVVRLAGLLQQEKSPDAIYGLARREMGPVLLHAAAFDPNIEAVALVESYLSYQTIADTRIYDTSFISNTVPGALMSYDLPDLAASLAPRKLLIAGSVNGAGEQAESETVRAGYEIARKMYDQNNAGSAFRISDETGDRIFGLFETWIDR
jgi:cephalosporin-C deacetylase-like acetyl esterase